MNRIEGMSFRAGDVLVACDNELDVPTGYLGHSAIAVDDKHMVEAVIQFPFVRLKPIVQFAQAHQIHAVYRPDNASVGQRAAAFAQWYYRQSMAHYAKGMIVPPFSFSPTIPLTDIWASVYCSKLVWSSYYYGAGLELPNDFFLFTPEDIDSVLTRSPDFTVLYKHADFHFVIDT